MTNIERLMIEVETDLPQNATDEQIVAWEEKMRVYLKENGLNTDDEYNPESNTNKKNILKTALSILESLANTRYAMQTSETGDFKFHEFYENLQMRIDALERKIRLIPDDYEVYNDSSATFVYIFNE